MVGDDLTPFFVAGEFAGSADTLDGLPVVGILDEAYVSTNDGIGMSSVRSAYLLPEASVPEPVEGKTLNANTKTFRIRDRELAQPGVIALILENV